jgi:hypothetical protein
MMTRFTLVGVAFFLSLQSVAVFAADALTEFKAGDRVKASEMNANFKALSDAIAEARSEAVVSFDGLEDVYGGITEEETTEVAAVSLQAANAAVVACSEEDETCQIVGNRASVICSAGEEGKLQSVLESPYAKAAFLLIEIDGDCVEDNLLVTRGAAFFSKKNISTKASITAKVETAVTSVGHYVYLGNIDINGQLTAGRGSSMILQENVVVTQSSGLGVAFYAGEGAFAMFGSDITLDGLVYAEGEASLASYGSGDTTVTGSIMLKGAGLVASGGDLTADSLELYTGSRVQLKNADFDIRSISVNGSNLEVSLPEISGLSASLTTDSIFVWNGGNLNLFMNAGFDMTASAEEGTFPQPGSLTLWDGSSLYYACGGTCAIRTMNIREGSNLRISPADSDTSMTVGTLDMEFSYGSHISANDGVLTVTDSLKAGYNTSIQYGVVSLTGALEVDNGCSTYGMDYLCPLD